MSFFLALLIFCFSTSVTPGPNNLMIMLSGVKFGIKLSMPHYLGILFGFSAMIILVGIGLGEIFTRYPLLHEIIKYFGAAYMLYLAMKTILADPHLAKVKGQAKPLTLIQALLFQWINPKAWIMAIGSVATYTTVTGNMLQQVLLISGTYFLVGIPSVGTWLVGGAALSKYLHNPAHMKRFNLTMGVLLILSIVLMFFE